MNPIKTFLNNKSLRWKMLFVIAGAIILMSVSLILSIRLNHIIMRGLENSYESNAELDYLTQQIIQTEKSLENYVNYHTFESIDTYYTQRNKVEEFIQKLQRFPSQNELLQNEYLVRQLSHSFIFFSNKTINACRSNDTDELTVMLKKTIDCYNHLLSQLLELNKLCLQENGKQYNINHSQISFVSTLSFLFFISFSILISFIAHSAITTMTQPLSEISEVAHRVSKRDFEVPLFNRTTNDEIGNICRAFDRMIISIREYIDTIWEKARTEAELKEKEIEMQALYTDAQLRALQNQVNPHFLFNTLNTGAQLAMMEGADKTCYFIEQVAEFFRYNIQHQTKTVSIDEELGLIENFVYIMKVRFGNRLEFSKNIPETSFPEQIPIMTLQPLVENCIKHGLKNTTGKVDLSINRYEKFIEISISDNGAGMPAEIKAAVFKAVQTGATRLPAELANPEPMAAVGSEKGNGTGLISVFLRLKLYFHRDDIFDITENDSEHETQKGTKFIIRIPKNV